MPLGLFPRRLSQRLGSAAALQAHRRLRMESLEPRRVLTDIAVAPGDYNGDGVVNAIDYTVWRDQIGTVVPAGTGADGDGSGRIDRGDDLVWRAGYGDRAAVPVPSVTSFQPIQSGADWFDIDGNRIEAHEGGIYQEGGTFYLYGTDRSSNNQWFKGLNLYSSTDLVHWEFENTILDFNSHPALQDRVFERPKILRNPTTGQYTLWWHHESFDYGLAEVGVAVSDTIDGDYHFLSSFRPLGFESRDIGMFQDDNGEAYLLSSISGNSQVAIFRLNDTYTGIEELVYNAGGNFNGEGLSMVKRDGTYFLFSSLHNGWTPNDNRYSTATSLAGPWTFRGEFVPDGSQTFFAQNYNSMVVTGPESSTVFFMGDRWQPQAQSQARSVFLPLEFNGTQVSLGWRDAWEIDAVSGRHVEGENHLGGRYKIVSRSSGLALTAEGVANGSAVEQATYTGATTQQWTVTQLGPTEGSYRITNEASGRVLNVSGNSSDDGAPIIVFDSFNAGNEKWRIAPTDGGYSSVMGVNSRSVLEVPGDSLVDGQNVTQRRRVGDPWQQWAFVPLDDPAAPDAPTNLIASTPDGIFRRLRLNWTAVPGAVSYQVKRAIEIDGPYTPFGLPTTVPSNLVGATVNEPYYYVVSATNAFGESKDSEPLRYVASPLRAWYPAEGDSDDASPNDVPTDNFGATFGSGHDGGQAWRFDGVRQTVTLPRVVGLEEFTISFWMQTTQTGGTGDWSDGKGLVDASVEGPFADFGVSLVGDRVGFGVGGFGFGNAGVTDTTITSNTVVNDGAWHHVAATYDADTGSMRLYLNGVLESTADGPRGARTTPQAIRIGALQSLRVDGFFEGAIDEVRLHEVTLSTTEIEALAGIATAEAESGGDALQPILSLVSRQRPAFTTGLRLDTLARSTDARAASTSTLDTGRLLLVTDAMPSDSAASGVDADNFEVATHDDEKIVDEVFARMDAIGVASPI